MLGAILEYKVIIVVDKKVSKRTAEIYKAHGAEVFIITEPDKNGSFQQARLDKVQELLQSMPNSYWINQYDNYANNEYHCNTTKLEIMEYDIDALVSPICTWGHICGIGSKIKNKNSDIKVVGVDVKGSAVLQKEYDPYAIHGVGLEKRAINTKLKFLDNIMIIDDFCAISMLHIIAKTNGIILGGSGA